jgi:uncharacterized hydrophobic protein (TIGR00271 family)
MKDDNPKSIEPRWLDRLFAGFPKLERDGRIDLFGRIETGAQGGVDYVVMMMLSSSLASLGLIEGATAVVIGAMLVAPLMGPLIGAGLALVQGNIRFFRKSIGVTFIGIGIALAVSACIGLINPGFEPSLEIEARGTPDLFDLAIAFVSGMAAAYASGRPNVAGTLAGVAIAAALVPPLAVVGIAFTNGMPWLAGNAAVLLVTNLVAIILGAAIIFRFFIVQGTPRQNATTSWTRKVTLLLILVAILLVAPLLVQMIEKRRTGQARPLTYPLAPAVREAVKEYIADWPAVDIVLMGRNSVEPEAGISIILTSNDKTTLQFEEKLREVVKEARGGDPTIQVFVVYSAKESLPGR